MFKSRTVVDVSKKHICFPLSRLTSLLGLLLQKEVKGLLVAGWLISDWVGITPPSSSLEAGGLSLQICLSLMESDQPDAFNGDTMGN